MGLVTAGANVCGLIAAMAGRALARQRSRFGSRRVGDQWGFDQPVSELCVRLAGRTLRPLVREDSCDVDLVHMIVCEASEYRLPAVVRPRVIFDIGANIGMTALYFSVVYPEADIYCFEPFPENVSLLRVNARRHSNRIRVIPVGLSDKVGSLPYATSRDQRNLGGGGFSDLGSDTARRLALPVTTVDRVMAELGLTQVDVFKIDAEGSELPILNGIPQTVRAGAQALIGELHGVGDWQVCDLLSGSHAVGVTKQYDKGCFPFVAVRRDLVAPGLATQHAA